MVIDIERVDLVFLVAAILVHPDDHGFAAVDAGLLGCRGFLDLRLGFPAGDIFGHPARRLDFLEHGARLFDQRGGKAFDVIAAPQRVGDIGDAGLFLDHQLRVARDAGAEIGR